MPLIFKQYCPTPIMMQDDSSDTETSSSEYESSEDGEETLSLTSSPLVKTDLFVTGEFSTASG